MDGMLKKTGPRILKWLRDSSTEYIGPCILDAPGAWTRCGPTWLTKGGIWLVYGPGVCEWGTTEGLAQLARDPQCTPQLHAVGVAMIPNPNLVFACTDSVLDLLKIRELVKEAEEFNDYVG